MLGLKIAYYSCVWKNDVRSILPSWLSLTKLASKLALLSYEFKFLLHLILLKSLFLQKFIFAYFKENLVGWWITLDRRSQNTPNIISSRVLLSSKAFLKLKDFYKHFECIKWPPVCFMAPWTIHIHGSFWSSEVYEINVWRVGSFLGKT